MARNRSDEETRTLDERLIMPPQNMLDGYGLLHAGTLALARAERNGMRIDVELCERHIGDLRSKIIEEQAKLSESQLGKDWTKKYGSDTNYGSDTQLSSLIYDAYGMKAGKRTAKGQGSTDEEALRSLGIEELSHVIAIRKYSKIETTYLGSYVREQVNGFIHPSFSLHTTVTYRSSSSDPNLQNVPVRDETAMEYCRSVIFARKKHRIVEVDWKGAEVSAAACYHKDPEMIRYLKDPKSDMHADQAYVLFKLQAFDQIINSKGLKSDPDLYRLRQAAKNGFVFPEFYGDYYVNCASNLANNWCKLPRGSWSPGQGVPMPEVGHMSDHLIRQGITSLDAFTEHVKKVESDFWNKRFRVYNQWRKNWVADYQDKGWFNLLTGFRCQGVFDKNQCINYPVQGAAFHWLLWSLVQVDRISRQEKWDSRLVGEVHDSMLLDVAPEELEHVVATIRRVAKEELPKHFPWIIVPIDVEVKVGEIDGPWSRMSPYKD